MNDMYAVTPLREILQKNQLHALREKPELIVKILEVKIADAVYNEETRAFEFNEEKSIPGAPDDIAVIYKTELWGAVHSPVFTKWLNKPHVKVYDKQGNVLIMKDGKILATGHKTITNDIVAVRFH